MPTELSLIEQYRESHHAVAKMIAAGMTDSMIRQRTGITMRRLQLLKADPTFMNHLVAHYVQVIEEKWTTNADAYLDLGLGNMIRAEALIADRLDDDPDAISIATLNNISQHRADRFGYSKHSRVDVNIDFASSLDRAIARSSGAKVIEAQAEPATQPIPLPEPREAPAAVRPPSVARQEPQSSGEPRRSVKVPLLRKRRVA